MTEEVAQGSLHAGDHGSTYGGNPLATAAVCKVLEMFKTHDVVGHVNEVAPYLEEKLNALVEKYDCISERRGRGLMQGLVFDFPVGPIIQDAMDHGLILINAGSNIIRMVPPLIITKENVDEMISILEPAIDNAVAANMLKQFDTAN